MKNWIKNVEEMTTQFIEISHNISNQLKSEKTNSTSDNVSKAQEKLQGFSGDGTSFLIGAFFAINIAVLAGLVSFENGKMSIGGIITCIASLFIGIVLSIKGIKQKNKPLFKRLPNYIPCIAESKNGSLDDISAYLGYPYETVISDIEFLINKGILEKTFINHSKRIIISPLIGEAILKDSKSTVCPNCGATNKIIGQTTECEFCGSLLK